MLKMNILNIYIINLCRFSIPMCNCGKIFAVEFCLLFILFFPCYWIILKVRITA